MGARKQAHRVLWGGCRVQRPRVHVGHGEQSGRSDGTQQASDQLRLQTGATVPGDHSKRGHEDDLLQWASVSVGPLK